jgi:hypothetical protein
VTSDPSRAVEAESGRFIGSVIDLNPIARELFDLAERLLDIAEVPAQFAPHDGFSHEDVARRYLRLAQEAYTQRRKRSEVFSNPDLFGEPAWDIMLDLYIAQATNKKISVTSACIASAVPSTTGLRWLTILINDGLVLREHDPQDNRRVFVRLSETGVTSMEQYFDKLSD